MGMKFKETSLTSSEKEQFLRGTINDLNKALEKAKEDLKESDTYRNKKVVNGVLWGSISSLAVGLGAYIALELQMLEPSIGAVIGATMPSIIGSAGLLLGTLASPLVVDSDKIEKATLNDIEDMQFQLKNAKEELKRIEQNKR